MTHDKLNSCKSNAYGHLLISLWFLYLRIHLETSQSNGDHFISRVPCFFDSDTSRGKNKNTKPCTVILKREYVLGTV